MFMQCFVTDRFCERQRRSPPFFPGWMSVQLANQCGVPFSRAHASGTHEEGHPVGASAPRRHAGRAKRKRASAPFRKRRRQVGPARSSADEGKRGPLAQNTTASSYTANSLCV
ncbi:unnamed protein product, partial [Prorocentrum cordatum]